MGVFGFVGSLVVGAAVLGLWLDCRFGTRRPESAVRRFVHAFVAFAVLQIGVGAAVRIGGASASTGQRLSALFLLLLPSLVYAFLAALWLMRTLAEAARTAGR